MSKVILSALVLCATSTTAFAAVTVSSTPYGLAAPAHASVLVNFDQKTPDGFTLTGGQVRNISNSTGAEPAGDTSNYLAANAGDPATLMSTKGFGEVSFYWGSMDAYNTVTLLGKNGKAIESYTGFQVFQPANGNQSGGSTNRRVTFDTSGTTSPIYGLEFQSSSPAFEVDNIAFLKPVGAVPEPTTWSMMIGGLGLLGSSLRRSKKQDKMALALA